jgi:rhodanese-related sulfurtransferase
VSEAGRAVRQALALGGLAVLIAAAVHLPLIVRFARGEFRDGFFSAAEYPGIRMIGLEETEDLWRTGAALVLDARAEELFARGRVPGALNVPAAEAKTELSEELKSADRARAVVVYCEGGDCQSSLALAKRLHDEGFRDIRVFGGGWEAWSEAGLPEEKSEQAGKEGDRGERR